MDELELALQMADIADEISMRYFSRDPDIYTKDDGTLVTTADREIENALRARIAEEFPSHAILGEEAGFQGSESAPTWIIDPIDATHNYAWRIPIFGTLIALRVDGRSLLGIASAPALRERYEATRGDGARMNGKPIEVSRVNTLEEARICYGSEKGLACRAFGEAWLSILERSRRERGFGDFWGHVLVARGAADVMAEPAVAIWDVAALEVIIEEAGGRITSWDGRRYSEAQPSLNNYGTSLTTNGLLHDWFVEALSGG